MPTIDVNDSFNRADGALNVAGQNWTGTTTQSAVIVSNQVTGPSANTATHGYLTTGDGVQMSQITMTTKGSETGTTLAFVGVGMYSTGAAAGAFTNYYNGASWYRLAARDTEFRLEKKRDATSPFDTMQQGGVNQVYAVAPVSGDVIKITYDPATGTVTGYVNGVQRVQAIDSTPPPSTSKTVGFGLVGNTVRADTWVGQFQTTGSTTSISGTDTTQIGSSEVSSRVIAKSTTDSTQIGSTEAGSKSVSSPVQTVNDTFTSSAGGWLGSTGDWTCASSTDPTITSNRIETTTTGTAVHKSFYTGKQTVSIKIVANGNTTLSNKGGIMAGVENMANSTGSTYSWYGSSGEWYRFTIRASSFLLQKKAANSSTHATVTATNNPYTPSGGIVPGMTMSMSYDPATGDVECFVNNVSVIQVTGGSPLTGDHSRMGFYVEPGTIVDDFSASWQTNQTPTQPWQFFEFTGTPSNPTFIPLTAKYYDGSNELAINMSATDVYTGSEPPTNLPLVQPYHADALVESIGVNTGFNRDAIYKNNESTLIQAVIDLGVRHIRDRIFVNDVNSMSHATAFMSAGIKTIANLGQTSKQMGTSKYTQQDVNTIMNWISNHPTYVSAVTGLNEPNDVSNNAWATITRDWQKMIFDTFRTYSLDQYKHSGPYGEYMYVAGPALKDQGGTTPHPVEPLASGAYVTLKNTGIAAYMDRGQVHRYTLQNDYPTEGNTPTYPEYNWERIGYAQAMAGGKEMDYTEYGFWSGPTAYSGTVPDALTMGIYQVRMLIESFAIGMHRTYTFDLTDDGDQGTTTNGSDPPWGLMSPSFVKKAGYYEIQNLISQFKDTYTGTTPYVPPKFGLRITPTPSDPNNPVTTGTDGGLRAVVFAKRDKTKQIVMWRLVRIFDKASNSRITNVSATSVTIETDGATVGTKTVSVKGFPVVVPIDANNNIGTPFNLTATF